MKPLQQTTGLHVAPVRRDHRAKESGPRAHGNNRQFLSVVPSTILIHELGWHHSTIGVPDGRGPIFPPPRRPSAAAPAPDPTIRRTRVRS